MKLEVSLSVPDLQEVAQDVVVHAVDVDAVGAAASVQLLRSDGTHLKKSMCCLTSAEPNAVVMSESRLSLVTSAVDHSSQELAVRTWQTR